MVVVFRVKGRVRMAEPEVVKVGRGVSGYDPAEKERRAAAGTGNKGRCSCGAARKFHNTPSGVRWICTGCARCSRSG